MGPIQAKEPEAPQENESQRPREDLAELLSLTREEKRELLRLWKERSLGRSA